MKKKIFDIDKLSKKGSKQSKDMIISILSSLGLGKKEIKVYMILLKSRLKIKQLAQKVCLSERTLRRYLKYMQNRGVIERKIVVGKRLAYEYLSSSPLTIWKNFKAEVKRNISLIDKSFVPMSKSQKSRNLIES